MMNSKFKDHVQILLAYVVSYLITFWVLASIIQTGCNAIFDGESGVSYMVGSVISYMVFPLIAFVIIYFRRKRVHKDRRAYLALMKEKDFDAKEDIAAPRDLKIPVLAYPRLVQNGSSEHFKADKRGNSH